MSDASQAELGVTQETVVKVKTQIADTIDLWPNVRAKLQPDGKIDVSPQQEIEPTRISSWQRLNGGQEQQKDERVEGRSILSAVSSMIREELAADFLKLKLSPADILAPSSKDSLVYKIITENSELWQMLRLDQTNYQYTTLVNKGYPPTIARAIIIAVAQKMARSVDTIAGQETAAMFFYDKKLDTGRSYGDTFVVEKRI